MKPIILIAAVASFGFTNHSAEAQCPNGRCPRVTRVRVAQVIPQRPRPVVQDTHIELPSEGIEIEALPKQPARPAVTPRPAKVRRAYTVWQPVRYGWFGLRRGYQRVTVWR